MRGLELPKKRDVFVMEFKGVEHAMSVVESVRVVGVLKSVRKSEQGFVESESDAVVVIFATMRRRRRGSGVEVVTVRLVACEGRWRDDDVVVVVVVGEYVVM